MTSRSRYVLLAGYGVALGIATLAPLPSDAYDIAESVISDKVVHFFLFGGLAALLSAFRVAGGQLPEGAVIVAILAAAVVELIQIPLPYRSGDQWDLLAGAGGALVAVTLVAWVRGWWE